MVWLLGLCLFSILHLELDEATETNTPAAEVDWFAPVVVLDVLAGQLAVLLAAGRRRWPLAIALSTMLLTSVSAFALFAAYLAVLSLATHRRLAHLLVVGLAGMVAWSVYNIVFYPQSYLANAEPSVPDTWLDVGIPVGLGALVYGICALVGWNIGMERVGQAQLAERARIAPEMHDSQGLGWWQHGWRLAAVWLLGFFMLSILHLDQEADPTHTDDPAAEVDWFTPVLVLDVLAGQLAVLLAAGRRRWPLAITISTILLTSVSAFALPAALLATISLATHRRLAHLLVVGLAGVVAWPIFSSAIFPQTLFANVEPSTSDPWFDRAFLVGAGVFVYGICAFVGWNIGMRRGIVGEVEVARVAQAQLAERARIAREMHDVLAHRLSLVAMHAGVLAHRSDLPEAERRQAAEVVRSGAHQALEELREVLGVLRAQPVPGVQLPAGAPVEAPQPGLSDIPSLVAEVTSGGQDVTLTAEPVLWPRSLQLPASTGRHVYRVVQEALTNARKHAPGAPVGVWLHGQAGNGLEVVIANPVTKSGVGLPSGGRGLTGMAERVQLVGGRFGAAVEGRDFVVRVWLPWPDGKEKA